MMRDAEARSNLTEGFMEEHSEKLKDVLVPYLSAGELARLACTCRLFRSWSSGARQVRLGLERIVDDDTGEAALAEDAWQPLGYLRGEAVVAKKRAIKVRMRMYTVHPNSDGLVVEHDVPPGTAVMPARTTLRVQLVRAGSGAVEEQLYEGTYWKGGDWGAPGEPLKEPQAVKCMIKHTLSSKRRPPTQFRLRFALEVVRHGTEQHAYYRYDTPPFWVLDPDAIPKKGNEFSYAHERYRKLRAERAERARRAARAAR